LRTILVSASYDSAVPAEARRMLSAVLALVYQTVDESVPPPPRQPRRRLKIRLQPKEPKEPKELRESPLSSDSEDTPLGALLLGGAGGGGAPQDAVPKAAKRKYQRKVPRPSSALDELVSVVDDDVPPPPLAGTRPPPLAGTRPPPLAVSDASLNSPVYTAPSVATPSPPPPIKLKLKLSKVASSAVLDTISSPLAREIPPATPSPPPPPPVPATTPLPPPPAPVTPLPPVTPATPLVKTETVVSSGIDGATRKLLHRVLRKLSRHADAFPFMRPVDVILDGCPTYYDVIKQPMDLGTVKRKLEGGEYATAEQFEADVRLMLANCYAFNPPGTPVHLMGES
ncbi:hypothetical protein GGI24_006987, partial [Coemansia furcata]